MKKIRIRRMDSSSSRIRSDPEDALIVTMLREALPDVTAIYRFGSTATGQAVRGSIVTEDLDDFLAFARWALSGA